jgi:hypothetical protein
MPRIRHWHPVSHDFVRDREVQELRRRFGHWLSDVWLEMLAEADKNEGRIRGDKDSISRSLAWVSLSNRPETQVKHIRNALDYMEEHGWIKPDTNSVLVCNYANYHKWGGPKKSHQGANEHPPLPTLPTLPTSPVVSSPETTTQNQSSGSDRPKRQKRAILADDKFIEALKQNPAYKRLDLELELGKFHAWFLTPRGRGKEPTRGRLIAWLNRALEGLPLQPHADREEPYGFER